MLLDAVRLFIVFVAGACLGSLVNWAIYSLAWNARPISPWSRRSGEARRRRWGDRVPVFGWLALSRQAVVHGPWFWVRPMLLEIAFGVALAALYWWEVGRLGLIQGQLPGIAIAPPVGAIHWQFISHALLLCLMLAASFIDIDEKIIPDEITVPGTLLGLVLATAVPMSLLPQRGGKGRAGCEGGSAGIGTGAREGRACDWAFRTPNVARTGDGGCAGGMAAGVGRAAAVVVARHCTGLLLALVFCARAADLAEWTRAGVRVAAYCQSGAAGVCSAAAAVAARLRHRGHRVRVGVWRAALGRVADGTHWAGEQRRTGVGGEAHRHCRAAARGDGLRRRHADDDGRHVSRLAGVPHRVFSRAVCGAARWHRPIRLCGETM